MIQDSKELPLIIKDSREKKGYSFRKSQNCAGMVVEKLDTGDYSVKGLEHIITIERKTVSDLYGSLSPAKSKKKNKDGVYTSSYERFMREMERIKDIPYRFIVIDGTLGETMRGPQFSQMSPNFIRSKLYELQILYNVHVIFLGKGDAAREYVRELLIKAHKMYHNGELDIGTG